MKKILLILCAAAVMFASCSKDNTVTDTTGGSQKVTLTVSADGMATRSNTVDISRYVMQVLDVSDVPAIPAEVIVDGNGYTSHKVQTDGAFELHLDKAKDYVCLFWADNDSDGVFNITDLHSVKLNNGKVMQEAYYTYLNINKGEGTDATVPLKRAVAKVQLFETDAVETGKPLTVTYKHHTEFGVNQGSPLNTTSEYTYSTTTSASVGQIAELFVFSSMEGTADTEFTFNYNGEALSQTVSNVPLKQNCITNINGNYTTLYTGTFTFTLDENWADNYDLGKVLTTTDIDQITPDKIDEAINYDGSLIIEGPVNENDINTIGAWAKANADRLKVLDIGQTTELTEIPERAFNSVSSLKTVILPSTLKTIGNEAFDRSGLTAIEIPEGVTGIEKHAFYGCSALTSVTLPSTLETIGVAAFAGSGLTTIEIPEGVTNIEEYTFSDCSALTSVTLPSTLETIGDTAFSYSGLTAIEIPEGITVIEKNAFGNCSALTSVTLPSTLETIGNWVFADCSALTSVTLPSTLKTIGSMAFIRSGLTAIEIPEGVTNIEEHTFAACSALTSVTLPSTLKTIGERVFGNCSALTSVTLPSTLKTIGKSAFAGSGLTAIEIPEGVTSMGEGVFDDCTALTSVTLPSTLETIGVAAFFGSGLTAIEIPEGVTNIEKYTFGNCSALTSVTLPSTLKTIGSMAFIRSGLTGIILPANIAYIDDRAFACPELNYVIFEGGLPAELHSGVPADPVMGIHVSAFETQGNSFNAFLPNITDEAVAQTYGDYFDSTSETVTVYYDYTGVGDRTDPANYTAL